MAKDKREYNNIEFSQLVSIIDKTLQNLQEWSWNVRQRKDGKKEEVVWWVRIPTNKSIINFPFYDLTSRLWGAYHKSLKIKASERSVFLECRELAPGIGFDTSGEKKLIIKEFFDHIESMSKDNKLSLQYQPRENIDAWKPFRVLLYIFLASLILIIVFSI